MLLRCSLTFQTTAAEMIFQTLTFQFGRFKRTARNKKHTEQRFLHLTVSESHHKAPLPPSDSLFLTTLTSPWSYMSLQERPRHEAALRGAAQCRAGLLRSTCMVRYTGKAASVCTADSKTSGKNACPFSDMCLFAFWTCSCLNCFKYGWKPQTVFRVPWNSSTLQQGWKSYSNVSNPPNALPTQVLQN